MNSLFVITRERLNANKRIDRLETELDRHPEKDAIAKWAIELLASRRYKRYLTITKTKRI